jgi:nitrogen fixation/metabolism regulation signal transduction histidine kinase
MTLRTKFTNYLIGLHLVLGVAAAFILRERPMLLFALEALFVLSVILGVRFVRALFVPLDLIRTGAELISERDFTSRFVEVGQQEMDMLIEVYNRMIDRLREERLAAEEQQQLLSKIAEASTAGIVICDFDGNIESMNPAAKDILRYAQDDVWRDASRLITQIGGRRFKVNRGHFHDRGFEKSFYIIEEMTEELRLSEKSAYEKLIRMMSHEVNNSVGAVRSLLESSLRYAPQIGEDDREDFRSALTIASARIDALNRFMAAFADVVRIPPPARTATNVAGIVERVVALLKPELEDRAIRVELDLADRGSYNVDENQIEQVVLNIFRNAIDAVGRDGSIRATLRDGALAVADSGPGIAEGVRSELFTPFFTTKREGRGLGLTIVQEILANHALPFSLTNREGGGAEFRIGF